MAESMRPSQQISDTAHCTDGSTRESCAHTPVGRAMGSGPMTARRNEQRRCFVLVFCFLFFVFLFFFSVFSPLAISCTLTHSRTTSTLFLCCCCAPVVAAALPCLVSGAFAPPPVVFVRSAPQLSEQPQPHCLTHSLGPHSQRHGEHCHCTLSTITAREHHSTLRHHAQPTAQSHEQTAPAQCRSTSRHGQLC